MTSATMALNRHALRNGAVDILIAFNEIMARLGFGSAGKPLHQLFLSPIFFLCFVLCLVLFVFSCLFSPFLLFAFFVSILFYFVSLLFLYFLFLFICSFIHILIFVLFFPVTFLLSSDSMYSLLIFLIPLVFSLSSVFTLSFPSFSFSFQSLHYSFLLYFILTRLPS